MRSQNIFMIINIHESVALALTLDGELNIEQC